MKCYFLTFVFNNQKVGMDIPMFTNSPVLCFNWREIIDQKQWRNFGLRSGTLSKFSYLVYL